MGSKVDVLKLSNLYVFDENGNKQIISQFWSEGVCILVFLRHFGCMTCRAHVMQIWEMKKDLQSSKRKIVFIGNGAAEYIKKFKEEIKVYDAPIYTDPTKESFDACGFRRGVTSLIHIKSLYNYFKLRKKGYQQGNFSPQSGNHFQMGGIVVIKPPGKVIYYFESEHYGDLEDPNDWKLIKSF